VRLTEFNDGDVIVVAMATDQSDPISEVTVRRAQLILRWVTTCRQVNHLGM